MCISQFILEDGGILDPTDDKSITWWDLNTLHRRCHSAHSVHSFSSQSEQYFSATSLLFFSEHGSQIVSMMDLQVEILWHWLFIKKKILTFLIKIYINIIILKYQVFKSLIARLLVSHILTLVMSLILVFINYMIFYAITLCFIMFICPFVGPLIWTNKILSYLILFVQSDVFCALCICSGVAKGYGCQDQALEMNRKVVGGRGGVIWSWHEGWKLAKITRK